MTRRRPPMAHREPLSRDAIDAVLFVVLVLIVIFGLTAVDQAQLAAAR